MWRLQAASDTDRFCSRNIDSRLSTREKAAVDEWVQSNKQFHVMRYHPLHSKVPMMCGTWCSTTLPTMEKLLVDVDHRIDFSNTSSWLNTMIWPMAQQNVLQHDSFSCDKFGGGRLFPVPRVGWEHAGSVYIDGEMRQFDIDLLQSTPAPTYCQHKNNSRPKRPVLTMVSTERLDTLRRVFAHSTLLKEVLVQNSELMQLGPKVSYNVVTLSHVQGAAKENSVRLQEFLDHFEKTCGPDIQFNVCQGSIDARQGYGITKGFVGCLQHAFDDNADIAYVFEDDARLLSNDFCDVDKRNRIWAQAPKDSYVMLLGGHKWTAKASGDPSYRHITYSYGAYAFSLRRSEMPDLIEGWTQELRSGKSRLSPDVTWFGLAEKQEQKLYAVQPLMIKHPVGWSNTWKTNRSGFDEPYIPIGQSSLRVDFDYVRV